MVIRKEKHMAKKKKMSMATEDHVEGGGLLDDVDVKWTACEFVMWDYNGKVAQAVPALKVEMELSDGEDAEQYFSAGKADDWEPSEDGKELDATGSASGLNKNSNLGILLKSLEEAGYPADKMGSDCTDFEGLECHMVRVPAPKRPGPFAETPAEVRRAEAEGRKMRTAIRLPTGAFRAGRAKESTDTPWPALGS